MAQLNITLNYEEMRDLLSKDTSGAFKKLMQDSLNAILVAESDEQINVERYERSDDRKDSRNGVRERNLKTRIGTITLTVPRHRNTPFHTTVFDNYSRSEAALVTTMAEMVVEGVSTRKVSKVMEELCDTPFSKSTVSSACAQLDEIVNTFRDRPLEKDYPFVIVDATYFKVRKDGRIQSAAFMIALGIDEDGHKEVIGFDTHNCESKDTWTIFLKKLKSRGLKGVKTITSDAFEGIISSIEEVFEDVPWQRCQFHFMRNVVDKIPKKYKEGISSELREMFNSKDINEARKRMIEISSDYRDEAEDAVKCLEEGFDDAMTVMYLPEGIRTVIRTSNHIERLNGELKRRSKVIGIFPNMASITRLMGAVVMEKHNDWTNSYKLFYKPAYNAITEDVHVNLAEIARKQHILRHSS